MKFLDLVGFSTVFLVFLLDDLPRQTLRKSSPSRMFTSFPLYCQGVRKNNEKYNEQQNTIENTIVEYVFVGFPGFSESVVLYHFIGFPWFSESVVLYQWFS